MLRRSLRLSLMPRINVLLKAEPIIDYLIVVKAILNVRQCAWLCYLVREVETLLVYHEILLCEGE